MSELELKGLDNWIENGYPSPIVFQEYHCHNCDVCWEVKFIKDGENWWPESDEDTKCQGCGEE